METVKQLGPWSSLSRRSYDVLRLCIWCTNPGIMKFGFKKKSNLTLKVMVNHPRNNSDLNQVVCIFCPNLVVLASIGGDLSRGQAQNGVNFNFNLNLTLKVEVNLISYRDINQHVLHFLSKFGDFSLNGSQVTTHHADKFVIDTHTHTDRCKQWQ